MQEIFGSTFRKLLEQSSTFVSNFISAALILIIGWIVARVAAWILKSFLGKLGFDRIGEKIQNIEVIKKYKFEFELSKIVSQVVFILIMLFLSVSAADTLGVPAISNMFLMLVTFIPKLIVAILMTLLGLFLSDLARKFVEGLCASFNVSSGKIIGLAVFFFCAFISIILALGQAGINTALLESSFNIIIAGFVLAFAIGYGFASKDILGNILSYIYSRNKYREGDVIEIQGVKGTVKKIDNTTITIESEKKEVVFPIKVLQNEKITVYK